MLQKEVKESVIQLKQIQALIEQCVAQSQDETMKRVFKQAAHDTQAVRHKAMKHLKELEQQGARGLK
ncbi:hypothetical protein [Bacillus sp. CGMCC 1.16541]|uniref:hypothetical protein n=1 Tax=Bacillus sp. CGMCC 1.16541 TaxID=2185143 RepID=UPI000D725E2D|nr:hypothetical protein [Bacillus sp. CGMCC 1.16541]